MSKIRKLPPKTLSQKIAEEMAYAKAERDEYELLTSKHNCFLRGCIYGHELNDYCICCGQKRPLVNLYGEGVVKSND